MKPRFSILTPFYMHHHMRVGMLQRTVKSIITQTYGDFEHILIDDGSRIPYEFQKDKRQVLLKQKHLDRAYALNLGLKHAQGEWICFLDSDDEYISIYLQAVDAMIDKYPEYKVFNFGSIHVHRNYGVTTKPVFTPERLKQGHAIFKSGKIVNGTFVFHRDCYEKLGGFPEAKTCWDFADKAYKEFPEMKELYRRPDGRYGEMGNPWGQDAYYFYKLTREYHSRPISAWLYIVHPRQGHLLERKDEKN